ncbi:ABC transporter ATP-binding protein [Paracoccus suum]|uniref:ABC transporter ATP-binding protein n=1 Tax=Paracoccus suum TaxID=2259340 RepID=A0A344PLB7_9RHOB|nr:ABC transporter ATP-binding protein [Paracoccus suum]AXC50172.1 ABC transporter ATP-binding protein [Paracoccus suum]
MSGAALEIEDVHAYYGKSHILQGVSLRVAPGEVVTLLGRNGAGKSTTLKTISGLVAPAGGRITFDGKDIAGIKPHQIAGRGLSLVPEDRGIFGLLTVEENLRIAQRKDSLWSLADVYRNFPRLEERKRNGGAQLSGGEQQMLAIARALVNGPKLLMLDEPVEGLAPVVVDEIVAQIKQIRSSGIPILLVEQNLAVCTELADRHYILELGRIAYEGTRAEFASDDAVKDRYLGVGAQ